jgi:hypothetical protein
MPPERSFGVLVEPVTEVLARPGYNALRPRFVPSAATFESASPVRRIRRVSCLVSGMGRGVGRAAIRAADRHDAMRAVAG